MPEFARPSGAQIFQTEQRNNRIVAMKRLGENIPVVHQSPLLPASCVPATLDNAFTILGASRNRQVHEFLLNLTVDSNRQVSYPNGTSGPKGINSDLVYEALRLHPLPEVMMIKDTGGYSQEYYAKQFMHMIDQESIPLLRISSTVFAQYAKQKPLQYGKDYMGHFIAVVGYKVIANPAGQTRMDVEILDPANGRSWEPIEKVYQSLQFPSFYQLKRTVPQ